MALDAIRVPKIHCSRERRGGTNLAESMCSTESGTFGMAGDWAGSVGLSPLRRTKPWAMLDSNFRTNRHLGPPCLLMSSLRLSNVSHSPPLRTTHTVLRTLFRPFRRPHTSPLDQGKVHSECGSSTLRSTDRKSAAGVVARCAWALRSLVSEPRAPVPATPALTNLRRAAPA